MTQHQNRFLAIMDNFNRVQEVNGELMNSNGKLNEGYAVYLDSVEASAKRAQASLEEMWIKSIDTDFVKGFYNASTAITQFLGRVNVLKVGLSVLSSIVLLSSKNYKSFQGAIGDVVIKLRHTNEAVKAGRMSLINFNGEVIKGQVAGSGFGSILSILKAKFTGVTVASVATAVAVSAAQAAMTFGLSIAITAVIAGLTKLISKFTQTGQSSEAMAQEIKGNIDGFQGNIRTLAQLGEEYDGLNKKMGEHNDVTKLSTEEQEKYHEIVNQLAEIAPEIVKGYDAKGNAIVDYNLKVDDLIKKEKELIELEKYKLLNEEKDAIKGANKKNKKAEQNIKDIDHDIQKLQEKLETAQDREDNKSNFSESQVAKNTQNLSEYRREIAELTAQRKMHSAEIDSEHAKLREFLNVYFMEIDALEQVDEAVKNVIRTKADETLKMDGLEAAKLEVFEYTEILKMLEGTLDGMDETQAEETFTKVSESLQNMGWSAEQAEEFLWDFKLTTDELTSAQNALSNALAFSTDEFKEMRAEISKLGDAYAKLSSGQSLTFDEMADLIEQNADIAKYVAETQDLTLKNGELLLGVMKEQQDAMLTKSAEEKNAAQIAMERSQQEVDAFERKVNAMEKAGLVSGAYHQKQVDKLNEAKEALKENTSAYETHSSKIRALNTLMGESFREESMQNAQDSFAKITSQLDSYRNILHDINEQKKSSGEVNALIMQQHPELIAYMHDEGELRKHLMRLIEQQGVVQQDMYRRALESTVQYTKATFETNKELYQSLADVYNLDLKNFQTVQELKIAVAQQSANTIAGLAAAAANSSSASAIQNIENQYNAAKRARQGLEKYKNGGGGTMGMMMKAEYDAAVKAEKALYNQYLIERKEQKQVTAPTFNAPKFKPVNFKKTPSSISPKSKAQKKTKTKEKARKPKDPIDNIELTTNQYLKFEKALEAANLALEKNNKLLSMSTGADRINLLAKEVHLMKQKQDILHKTANAYRSEAAYLKKKMSGNVNINDGTRGINSFNSYTKQVENEINGIIKQINGIAGVTDKQDEQREALTKKKDKIKKDYDRFKTDFERYIDLEFTLTPKLSSEWMDIEFEKFNKSLEMMETQYKKYEDRIDRVNDSLLYMLTIRDDNEKDLEKELELLTQVGKIYNDSLYDVGEKIKRNTQLVKYHEEQLRNMADRQSDQYRIESQALIMKRLEQDKLLEIQREGLNSYANHFKTVMDRQIADINRAKEATLKAIEIIRKEIVSFDIMDLALDSREIMIELNAIDKIFKEGVDFTLNTDGVHADYSTLMGNLKNYVSETQKLKDKSKEIMDEVERIDKIQPKTAYLEQEKNKQLEHQKKLLSDILEQQAKKHKEFKKMQEDLDVEYQKTVLNFKEDEYALQNKIDMKEEELKKLQKQFEYEDKIRQMLEKQLSLMRALDDTRFSYITGQGQETFTFDRDKVANLKKEIADAKGEEARTKATEKLQDEITKMQDDLTKTREINEQQLKVLELAKKNLDKILNVLDANISDNLGEDGLDKIYKSMENTIINEFKKMMEIVTSGLSDVLKDYFNRLDIKPTIEKPSPINPSTLNPVKFDTGGYTGGGEGLAMLHKKELILNAEDTRNMLEAVRVTDSFARHLPQANNISNTNISNRDSKGGDVVLNNPTFNEVSNMGDFTNEMQKMLRRGMPAIS